MFESLIKQQILICTSCEGCAQAKPLNNKLSPKSEAENNIYILLPTCMQKIIVVVYRWEPLWYSVLKVESRIIVEKKWLWIAVTIKTSEEVFTSNNGQIFMWGNDNEASVV